MIAGIIARHTDKIQKYTTHLKIICLLLALYFIKPSITKHELESMESLFKVQRATPGLILRDALEGFPEMPPHRTIAVIISSDDLLIHPVHEWIKYLRLRTKNIKILQENDFAGYFATILITTGERKSIKIHPLRNFQPNSDILRVSFGSFEPLFVFYWTDLFQFQFDNRLELVFTPSKECRTSFLQLLHYLMNVRSHSRGTYYYVPLGPYGTLLNWISMSKQDTSTSYFIRAEAFAPFIGLIIAVLIIDGRYMSTASNLLLFSLSCALCPYCALIFIRKQSMALHLFLCFVINFKLSYLLATTVYFYEVFGLVSLLFKGGSKVKPLK